MRTVRSLDFPRQFIKVPSPPSTRTVPHANYVFSGVSSSTATYPSPETMPPTSHFAPPPRFTDMREHLTYRVAHTFPVPGNDRPTALAINPEGTFIAVSCASGSVFIWCLNTCDLVCQASPPGCACGGCSTTVTSVMWLGDGMLFFGHCNGLIGVIRIGKVRQRLSQ